MSAADKDYIFNKKIDFATSLANYSNGAAIKIFTDRIENAIMTSANCSNLNVTLDNVVKDAESTLKCTDLDVVKLMASVSKNSAHFWFSTSMGVTGEGDLILNTISAQTGKPKKSTRDIVRADGQGVAGACIEFAIVGAFGGPVGAAGLFSAMLFNAAWSSGMSAWGN